MNVIISGTGIVSPIGIGIENFSEALQSGQTNFSIKELDHQGQTFSYPVAQVNDFDYKKEIEKLALGEGLKKRAKRLRNLSTGAMHGVCSALEAWLNAGLFDATLNPEKIAIVASGSNTQQATINKAHERYREKLKFINPTYGFSFLDTDIVGTLSELLDVKGEGHSIGAASASGNMAIIQGCRLIASGEYDVVLVVAPSMELSVYEYQGFTALGAMAVMGEGKQLTQLCNPFDESHCGFVHGQNAGAIILESESHAKRRGADLSIGIPAYGVSMDGNRNPNPSVVGEAKAMQSAMEMAELSADQIDLVNTHGTASLVGDQTEIEAILSLRMKGVKANATKALIGHGISAAGVVEAIGCVAQMKEGFVHPNKNLDAPISEDLQWVTTTMKNTQLNTVMSNSYGFGGINTSIIIQQIKKTN